VKRSRSRSFYLISGFALLLVAATAWQLGFSGSAPQGSFDEIRRQIHGKSAAEALALLGEPDTRQEVFGGDVRFIWWRRAVLAGPSHPPELRGKVVHLYVFFRKPQNPGLLASYAAWKMDDALGVGYWLPGESERNYD
jgi:hypothetical protein